MATRFGQTSLRLLLRAPGASRQSVRKLTSLEEIDPVTAGAPMWKKYCIFGVIPALALGFWNAFILGEEHLRPEFRDYPHLGIRSQKFLWGDGNHSLFHHPQMNALPEIGFEEELDHH